MIVWLRHFLGWVFSALRSRENLILENLALRQQLLAFHAKRPRRRLPAAHQLFWVVLRRVWAGWKQPLVVVIRRGYQPPLPTRWRCYANSNRVLTRPRRSSNSGDEHFVDACPLPLVREFYVCEASQLHEWRNLGRREETEAMLSERDALHIFPRA